MYRSTKVAIVLTATALLALSVWGGCGLTKHIIVAVDRFGDAGAGMAQTFAKVNGKHGTIAMADETIGASKSLIIHADLVARHEQQSLDTWDARGTDLFNNLNGGITDLRGAINTGKDTVAASGKTADAATRLLDTTSEAIDQLNNDQTGITPLARSFLNDSTDLDALLKRQAISQILDHAAGVLTSADGIAADGKKVADKATLDYITPKPWYVKARNYAGDTYDLLAFAARHTP